jgi:hypothetical protein
VRSTTLSAHAKACALRDVRTSPRRLKPALYRFRVRALVRRRPRALEHALYEEYGPVRAR